MEEHDKKEKRLPQVISRAGGIIAAGFGALALLGWVLGFPLLASLGKGWKPMSPSTAFLFVMYGTTVFLSSRTPLSHRAHRICMVIGSAGMLVALLLFFLSCLDIHPAAEHLGIPITGVFAGQPIGHMAPVTAFCFVLAGLSFLASLYSSAGRPKRALAALWFAYPIILICFVLLLAYFLGDPLFYEGYAIPPALSTALAFIALGISLSAFAELHVWPQGKLIELLTTPVSYTLVLIFAVMSVGIVTTGYLYYRVYEKHYRLKVENQLSTIAELKTSEIVQYRKERLGDASLFFKNLSFSTLVRRFFENYNDMEAKEQLQAWLNKVQSHYQYESVLLLDVRGVARISLPKAVPVDSIISQRASDALRSRQVVFQDFYRNNHDRRIYLAILVPVLDRKDSNRPLGVLILRIDPRQYLYPFILRWPTGSRTAETLLIRREGNDAVFLNELRFQKDTALNLRIPLDRKEMPAVQAALGFEGTMSGRDYRGKPVIAYVRAIPGSPWFLVARMDVSEVYTPLKERLWIVVAFIAALLSGAGTCIGLIWRGQRTRFYRERYEAAEALRKAEEMFQLQFKNSPDIILIIDSDYRILMINQILAGDFTVEGLKGADAITVLPSEYQDQARKAIKQCFETGKLQEIEHGISKGKWVRARIVPINHNEREVTHVMIISTDITDRKRAEEYLSRINTGLLNLGYDYDLNIQLLTALCGELLQAGCALYNRLDGDLLHVRGQWNAPPGMKMKDTPEGHVCFDVIRKTSESPLTISHLQETEYVKTDPNVHAYGLQTYIGQTVRFGGVARGSLCAVYNRAYEPTDDDVRILGIIASAIGQEEERRRAEETIRRQNDVISAINEVFREVLRGETVQDVAQKCLDVASELTGSQFGFIGEINQRGMFDTIALSNPGWSSCLVEPSKVVSMIKNMDIRGIWGKTLKDGQSLIVNDPASHPDSVGIPEGHSTVSSFLGIPLKKNGATFGMIALANKESGYDVADRQDIEHLSIAFVEALSRKQVEIALTESEDKYRSLVLSADSMYLVDRDCRYLFVNERHQMRFGIPLDEIIGRRYQDLHTYKDSEKFAKKVREVCETGKVIQYEHRSGRDGRYFLRTFTPVKEPSPEGKITRVAVVSKDITLIKQAEEELRTSRQQLKALAARLQQAREESRIMISREIHDELGGGLTGLKMDLAWLSHKVCDAEADKERTALVDKIHTSSELIDQMIHVIRRIATELRPSVLDDLGLIAALEWQLDEFQSRTEIPFEFAPDFDYVNMEQDTATAVFRIFQEALTNVARHSGATKVAVLLREEDGNLFLEIRDNGRGITEDEMLDTKSLGILGMKERVFIFGGELRISSEPGGGTAVILKIPQKQGKIP